MAGSRDAEAARVTVHWIALCTPGMGVSSWGESPLYKNLKVFIIMDTTKSISRRQGRFREEGSEGSRSVNVQADGQKPHTRLSSWASWHNTTKPTGSGGRVNAAVVHRKFTSLSGEICASCDRRFMRRIRNRFTRLTKYPAHPPAVDECESPYGERGNTKQTATHDQSRSALYGNIWGKHAEVSRRHSSPGYQGRRPERGNEWGIQ